MKLRNLFLSATVVGALALTIQASAEVISTFTSTVGTSSSQLGRLSRNGVPADWSSTEAFPGILNTTTTYYYKTFTFSFAQLDYGQYIQIDMDSLSANTFISAYLNGYDPNNKATNYLGDAGSSGNYFGVDPITFQVIVPSLQSLVLVVTNTAAAALGTTDPFTITVESFSDTDFDDPTGPPSAVPEPSTFVLLGSGVAGIAGMARRRWLKS